MLWPAIVTFELEQSRAPGSGVGDALSAGALLSGANERSRPLWPGINAALTVSGGKHARVMKRVWVGQERVWQQSGHLQTRDDVC